MSKKKGSKQPPRARNTPNPPRPSPVVPSKLNASLPVADVTSHDHNTPTNPATNGELELKIKEFEAAKEEHDQRQKTLDQQQQELEDRRKTLDDRESAFQEQEIDLRRRELSAEAGFHAQHRQALEGVEKQINDYRALLMISSEDYGRQAAESLKKFYKKLLAQIEEHNTLLSEQTRQHIESLQAERDELQKANEQLQKERLQIEKDRRALAREWDKIQVEKEDIQEREKQLEKFIHDRVQLEYADLQRQLEEYRKFYKDEKDKANIYIEKLGTFQRLRNKFGDEPDQILQKLQALQDKIDQLQAELDEKPRDQEIEHLKARVQDYDELQDRLWRSEREKTEIRREIDILRRTVIDVETLRDERDALETSRTFLQNALNDLRADMDRHMQNGNGDSPFPQLTLIDSEDDYNEPLPHDRVSDLRQVTQNVRNVIASKGFFYEETDIRSFIAGMAMSNLLILQGISGTGKTSLPIKFAEAVGGYCEVIEVQAGWRDRNDLIGYFNAFEKRFYESKLVQALYRAQTPKYKNRIVIIVLDEMNLSYPEQYFADFLSAMQMDDGTRRAISLLPMAIQNRPIPRLLKDNGRNIQIPDNVWFVGTANQDETTKDIADKTYDRAHIMELPSQHPTFRPQSYPSRGYDISDLDKLFDKACTDHKKEADETRKSILSLQPELNKLSISWGNRLTKQIERYVPVVVACGGTREEAVDYLLAVKLLRKLINRYDLTSTDFDSLRQAIERSGLKSKSSKTESILKRAQETAGK